MDDIESAVRVEHGPSRIEDYALIGDCETAALVSRRGSIDWLCWPRFDSDACFAALLGDGDNGHWTIRPCDAEARFSRRYRGRSLILETRFETPTGVATLIDFMPPRGENSDIVRLVVGEAGRVEIEMELVVRFGYGRIVPWVSKLEKGGLRAVAGPDMVVLQTPVEIEGRDMRSHASFAVEAGDRVPFVLTYAPSHRPLPAGVDPEEALQDCERGWEEWAGRCTEAGPWTDIVARSMVTLKALTYRPTGGIVAAPTSSLPEQLGGKRNWDYRFCWLRDTTLTLLALMNGGYFEEAKAWRDWLLRAVAGSPDQIQIMYGLAGERRLAEWEVPWLAGYEGSRPVRIGNAAHGQLQLDVFGEVMDALHQGRKGGLPEDGPDWPLQRALISHLETIWREPDEGIWETRGGRRHFTYSKVMCWVAVDRAIQSAETYGLPGPVEQWKALRATIHADVCAHGFNAEIDSFVQTYGGDTLDASLLLLPSVGFLPASDPRIAGTVRAIEQRLMSDGFVLRYRTEETMDGLPEGEGAFLACSFWLADVYVLMGREPEARALFERLLALANDIGLLAEEYDPRIGRQVGNFPQAFSHVALVNTAHNLSRYEKPVEQRAADGN